MNKPGHITALIMQKGYKIEPIGIGAKGYTCTSFKLKVTHHRKEVKGSMAKTYPLKEVWKKLREIEKFIYDDILTNGGKANNPQKPH